VRWEQVQLRANVALWNPHGTSALGQPRGELWMTVDRAVLQGGWPLQLDLRAHWCDAAVLTRRGKVALGAFDSRVTAHAGVVDATVSDVAVGPLQVNGALRLSPLGWSLDARLRARHADPALQHWLAALDTADATGIVHVHRRGGLTLPPAVPTSTAFDVSSTRPQQGSP
jgi:general secretion pathway protein N